jgi:ABC-type polysaccharide/polyol phosphate transport system ATPase subunit
MTRSGRQKHVIASTGGQIDAARGVVDALCDINLDLKEGDRLGLMGHNGAGKSTMLRLLAGAYTPTRGRVISSGRISTLFSSTPGLSVEATGRENIVTCGLYLGMSRRAILSKMDEIADFAELGDYIDLPVRIYSTGMLVRLGFAIATAIEPEILLLDEGLATGDAQFARKAEQKMQELIGRTSILVIASHSMALLSSMCTQCVLLEHGKILFSGAAQDVAKKYQDSVIAEANEDSADGLARAHAIATDLGKRGLPVPPALEEQSLRWALQIHPDDVVMLERYVTVLLSQDKKVPAEWELRALVARLQISPEMKRHLGPRIIVLANQLGDEVPAELKPEIEKL